MRVVNTYAQLAVVGGGIAGLWVLNRLLAAGYDAVLLETGQLGGGQTLASQGIIHGGLKYALNGVLSPASSAIADMPLRWQHCLQGSGELDLRQVRVLSPHYYMWSDGSARSRLKTFLGSKALRGRIDSLQPAEYPAFFNTHKVSSHSLGTLYQLSDFVIDTPSLIATLASAAAGRIYKCSSIQLQDNGLRVRHNDVEINLNTARTVLCAGAGNQTLLSDWQSSHKPSIPDMQRRPLHMVAARIDHPAPAYLHCIGNQFGMTPRLTITSHPTGDNSDSHWIWYLGGELAESGVFLSHDKQQVRAQQELAALFPWVSLEGAQWFSFLIDRAEPAIADRQRPDQASLTECGHVLVCWPTKLTLTPNLGDRVLVSVATLERSAVTHKPELADLLPAATLASEPWEHLR